MGTPNPKPSKVTVTSLTEPLVLYVKIGEVSPLIGNLSPDAAVAPTIVDQNVPSHSRRRYSGGPAQSVTLHVRKRSVGGNGAPATLPGNNAWLERPATTPNGSKRVEQITFVGTFAQLKAWCSDRAVVPFVLRSPWGEPFPMVP